MDGVLTHYSVFSKRSVKMGIAPDVTQCDVCGGGERRHFAGETDHMWEILHGTVEASRSSAAESHRNP
jgi:hypothetical protein